MYLYNDGKTFVHKKCPGITVAVFIGQYDPLIICFCMAFGYNNSYCPLSMTSIDVI